MDDKIIATFCLCDDLLKAMHHQENRQCQMNDAEIMTIAVCYNIRIRRSKIYSDEDFRGYQASKKRYFYGLKIHLMVTQDGQPVECFLTPGGFGDVDALKYYAYALPDGSIIYADKAYNDYEIEDLLKEVEHIHLLPIRKKNSKRALSPS